MPGSQTQLKLAAILLAAGGSSRLGQAKQLVTIEGQPLVRRSASLLIECGFDPLLVVTGAYREMVDRALDGLEVQRIYNPDWSQGMGSSLALAAASLEVGSVDGVLVMLADQWDVGVPDIERLKTGFITDISMLSCASFQREESTVISPPALFPGIMIRELAKLTGDHGAKPLIGKHSARTRTVELAGASSDLDTPEDLARLRERYRM